MRIVLTERHVEIGSWIATILGVPLMLYQFYATVMAGPTPAPVSAVTTLPRAPGRGALRPDVSQRQDSGTQIGFAENVTINNGKGDDSNTGSAGAARVELAAFNVNSNGGYWGVVAEDGLPAHSRIRYRVKGTEYWSELANCMEFSKTKRQKKICGDETKLLPIFDVALTLAGHGQAVLNEIRVQIIYMSEYKGAAGDVPSAAIPKSAKYSVQLPPVDGDKIVRVGAIPPLLIEKDRPARFELLFSPGEPTECIYHLYLEFVLSSGQIVSTDPFELDFSQGSVPEPGNSRIPAAAKQYWRNF
jgi:hypothetical protein